VNTLQQRILNEAVYIGNGIIKVDGFLNHQIDPQLMTEFGREFVRLFKIHGVRSITKILTVGISGIAPALAVAQELNIPMVFARKQRSITMIEGCYQAAAMSRTGGKIVQLSVSREYMSQADRVVLIDDFLATGETIRALAEIINQSRASLLGVGCVLEKVFEEGREKLSHLNVPLISLARLNVLDNRVIIAEQN